MKPKKNVTELTDDIEIDDIDDGVVGGDSCFEVTCAGCGASADHTCPADALRSLSQSAVVHTEIGEPATVQAFTASRDQARYTEYVWIPAGPNSYAPGRTTAIDSVLLHIVPGDILTRMVGPESTASIHFFIPATGPSIEVVDEIDTAFHAGDFALNCRSVGIGIAAPASADQIALLVALLTDLTVRYGPITIQKHPCAVELNLPEIQGAITVALAGKPVTVKQSVEVRPSGIVLRAEPLRSDFNVRAQYPGGTVLTYSAEVRGEIFAGEALWIRLANGLYGWLGATSGLTKVPYTAPPAAPGQAVGATSLDVSALTPAIASSGALEGITSDLTSDLSADGDPAVVRPRGRPKGSGTKMVPSTASSVAMAATAPPSAPSAVAPVIAAPVKLPPPPPEEVAALESFRDPRDPDPYAPPPIVGGTGSVARVVSAATKVRAQPLITARVERILPPGVVLDYKTQVVGSDMDGINTWLLLPDGHYIWAGDVQLV